MAYSENHSEDDNLHNGILKKYIFKKTVIHNDNTCDKCCKRVGKANLKPVSFMYLDKNDKMHPDMGNGYRLYYCCPSCFKEGV